MLCLDSKIGGGKMPVSEAAAPSLLCLDSKIRGRQNFFLATASDASLCLDSKIGGGKIAASKSLELSDFEQRSGLHQS